MACFFKTKGLELPFVQGLNANIASVRQMTAQWRHYAEDLATVRDIINHGGEHVFAVRNLYVASFAHCLFVTLWQVQPRAAAVVGRARQGVLCGGSVCRPGVA